MINGQYYLLGWPLAIALLMSGNIIANASANAELKLYLLAWQNWKQYKCFILLHAFHEIKYECMRSEPKQVTKNCCQKFKLRGPGMCLKTKYIHPGECTM